MKAKIILYIHFLICVCTNIYAQSISVSSFKLLPNDLTANTNGTEVLDQNGEKAALIKVVTTQMGFTFEGGALGITKVKQESGEIWVYVPQKSKKITVKHQQLGVLRDYVFPCGIEAARTYEMILSSGSVHTVIKKDVGGNFLALKVIPENASVYLDGALQQNDTKGEYSIFLDYGEHSYRIEAAGYSPQTGVATIGKAPFNLNVKLESCLATLSISCPTNGAQIFINKQLKGTDNWKGNVSAGKYLIEASREGYRNIIENIEVGEKEYKTITLQALQPIYGILKVNVKPIGSIIEIDGENVGKTPAVINDVIVGSHSVKIKSQSGYEIVKNISVIENEVSSIDETINETIPLIFEVVEQMPSFPGGMAALMVYLQKSIKYPPVAEENGIQGRVVCSFVVERDGSITDVKVAKSVDPSLDMEAVRVVRAMPRWTPGKLKGEAVRVKYTMPVTFRLQ